MIITVSISCKMLMIFFCSTKFYTRFLHQVTFAPLVPPLALFMAKHEIVTKFDLTSITNIICGAAPLSGEIQALLSKRVSLLLQQLFFYEMYYFHYSYVNVWLRDLWFSKTDFSSIVLQLSGVRVRQGYGLTETTLATFSSETDLPGAVGTVTAHCEAKVRITLT